MKAAVHSRYGLPGDLCVKEIPIPTPKDDEVLIQVHASTVNRSDCHVLSGKPYLMRLFTGISKPKSSIIGSDFAGQVAAIGSSVQSFKVGENIMGFGGGFGCGSHAQYFILSEARAKKVVIIKPDNLSFYQAAACLEGAVYAAGIHQLNPVPGKKALVYGATGAIGSAYVQFLKHYGVTVTAVCGGENEELVRSLGADRVIDYKKNDFTKDTEQYDLIFDAIGRSSFFKCKHLLKKKGIFTSSGGAENMLLLLITSVLGGKKVTYRPPKSIKLALTFIKDLIEKGQFKPVIDRNYTIEEIRDAFIYVASGQKIGNVIITMD